MVSSSYIHQIFNTFSRLTITVAGDVMADNYIEGKVERISPEAPVPVVEAAKKYTRPGGAGNVALNLISLGAKVNVCAVIGDDKNGKTLTKIFSDSGINTAHIFCSPSRITTSKTRILGNHIQMLRVDEEETDFLNEADEATSLGLLEKSIAASDALLFQDYDKGFLTSNIIEKGIQWAKQKNTPITVDPKIRNFLAYKDITLFKPNLKELRAGLHLAVNPKEISDLRKAAQALREKLHHQYTLITLSELGVYGEENGHDFQLPAHVRNIADVSGAGDSVIAVATLCMAAGADYRFTAALANLAGGMACEWPGVVPVDKQKLLEEALKLLAND